MIFLVGYGIFLAYAGTVVAAGPAGVLVMQAGFDAAPRRGRWIGLGSAVGQSPYAGLAFYGANRFVTAHADFVRTAHGVAGLVLFAVAAWVAKRAGKVRPAAPAAVREGRAFLLGLTATVTNPVPLVTWGMAATALTASGIAGGEGLASALGFGAATIVGAAAAHVTITHTAAALRAWGGDEVAKRLSYGSAALLVGLGSAAVFQAWRG